MNMTPALVRVILLDGQDHYALMPLGHQMAPDPLCGARSAMDVSADRDAVYYSPCEPCTKLLDQSLVWINPADRGDW